jgi:exodeoxyribonuclease V beta subunit
MINYPNDDTQSDNGASLVHTSANKPLHLNNLNAATIPLSGTHLIEASAGTGKTYNITRIYLRLLLERQIPVEKILLMTFTKDATQELRGRIDAFIRLALSDWASLSTQDNYFAELEQRIDVSTREFLLQRALLFLDEAAIFTIHGFCQRVLKQYAFSSGLPFDANMTTNTNEITLQACQDWYRTLAKEDESNFTLLANFWPTPDSFISSFSKAISHHAELSSISAVEVEAAFIELATHASVSLKQNAELFETALITVKKGKDQQTRRDELAELLNWLDNIIQSDVSIISLGQGQQAMPDAFFDGKRYARSAHKDALLIAFKSVKTVKEQLKIIVNNINRARAYTVVKNGIYVIRQSVTQQKEQANLLDFDDLINTLANCLTGEHSAVLAKQLLNQYPVALIDEFQDTDPKQFSILQAIYYGDYARKTDAGLYLIGDPKQAIYGFRGGDIFAYLNARQTCDFHWLMDTNWRSSVSMISAYNQVFSQKCNTENSPNINSEEQNKIKSKQVDDQVSANNVESVFGFGIPYQMVLAGKQPSQRSSQNVINNEHSDDQKALQFIHFSSSDENNVN